MRGNANYLIDPSSKQKWLPFIGAESPIMTTRNLQMISGSALDELKLSGPRIVIVNNQRKAVLVDFEQYVELQDRFHEMFRLLSMVPRLPELPAGYAVEIHQLKIEVTGTLHKIVAESPESSPFADLYDAILSLAQGVFGKSVSAPAEMTANARSTLEKSAKKVDKKSDRPRKPNIG